MIFDMTKIADPTFFEENKLPPHSDHKIKSVDRISLNGLWKFKYERNPENVNESFVEEGFDASTWEDIRVPAHMQLEGYDKPMYVNIQYPWDGHQQIDPGEVPTAFNPVGCYVKYIDVAKKHDGTYIITFQGVESAFSVWVNGKYVGYSEGSFLPAEFDVTSAIKEGRNTVAVAVIKWSSSSWAEDQDFFRFSGIFRDVYFTSYEKAYIEDVNIKQTLSDDFSKGVASIKVKASGKIGETKIVLVKLGRTDLGLESDCFPENWNTYSNEEIVESKILSIDEGENSIEFDVEKPFLWSAEEPNLYEIRIGNVSQMFGFRRFGIVDGVMYLNGKRIVFKGVNRHEFSGVTGRTPSVAELWQDIVTMKKNNINAIRTCHYPNNSPIYELCDRLGLYMIDENDLETHGIWVKALFAVKDIEYAVPGNRPEWKDIVVNRAYRMYERDKNHPSILMWSCGNESFGGNNIKCIADYFRSVDDSRIVHYEGVFNDRRVDISDVESQMYTSVDGIKAFLEKDRRKPFICCEYMHAMGNSCGAMHKYTDLAYEEKQYQGGFIWDYIDQSMNATDKYGVKYQKYGGDFDDRPSDYQFSGNGIVYGGSRLPSPKMQEVKFNYQNYQLIPALNVIYENDTDDSKNDAHIGNKVCVDLKIKNLSLFTDTAIYDTEIKVEKNGICVAAKVMTLSVKPDSEAVFENVIEVDNCEAAEYVVTASLVTTQKFIWSKPGYEIAFGQGKAVVGDVPSFVKGQTSSIVCDRNSRISEVNQLQIVWGDGNIGIKGEHFSALVSYKDMELKSYVYGGKEMLKDSIKPNFWRAPIDNDCGNDYQMRYAQWKLASMYQKMFGDPLQKASEVKLNADHIFISHTVELATSPKAYVQLSYKIYGNGVVQVGMHYDPVKELGDMPEYGLMFKLDSQYNNIEWYGNGPDETYADRKHGAKLGLFENTAEKMMAAYMIPQECGNLTDVRFAKVMDEKRRGLLFAAVSEDDIASMNFSALPYSPHELENATHPNELPPALYTYVRLSKAQMGVGGDNSWGARVHDEYLIDVSKPLDFEIAFVGI